MVRSRLWLAALLGLAMAGTSAPAQDVNWQEAVARLAQERTIAETCARVLKKYGGKAAIERGSLAYGEAKAEYDGIVAGLSVALASRQPPNSLADLQDRLRRGFEKRAAFCESVKPLNPNATGTKGGLEDIAAGAIGPLVQAVQAIYMRSKDDDALARKTIQTQLEATSWPAFTAVTP